MGEYRRPRECARMDREIPNNDCAFLDPPFRTCRRFSATFVELGEHVRKSEALVKLE